MVGAAGAVTGGGRNYLFLWCRIYFTGVLSTGADNAVSVDGSFPLLIAVPFSLVAVSLKIFSLVLAKMKTFAGFRIL